MRKYNEYIVYDDGTIIGKRLNKPMKQSTTPKGYKTIYLRVDGKSKKWFIHRLVASLYVANPKNKPQVNHIDGDKQNNHYTNLEWVTNQENQIHAIQNGLTKKVPQSKRTKIADMYNSGMYNSVQLGKLFKINPQTVMNIVKEF